MFQVSVTSQTFCPILNDFYDRVKLPMVLMGDRTPFEAALFAGCIFVNEFIGRDSKIDDLIGKLMYRWA